MLNSAMTKVPHPRIQELPTIRRDLKTLEELTRTITLALEQQDVLSLKVLEDLTRTLHGVFALLEDLLPGLNVLSLERHSQEGETELEATFLEFRTLRGAVMAALGVLGSQAVSALRAGPGLFPNLDHVPVPPEPARFEGDWTLPVGATLRAVLFVELPELEVLDKTAPSGPVRLKNPPPGPRLKGGDYLTVAYQMIGDPEQLLRVATRFRYARGPARASEMAQWFDGEVRAPLPEALSKLTLVAESLAHNAGQTLLYQELSANRETLRATLERERPRWEEFVLA